MHSRFHWLPTKVAPVFIQKKEPSFTLPGAGIQLSQLQHSLPVRCNQKLKIIRTFTNILFLELFDRIVPLTGRSTKVWQYEHRSARYYFTVNRKDPQLCKILPRFQTKFNYFFESFDAMDC